MPETKKKVALVLREISDHLRGNLYGILNYVQKNRSWEVYTEGALPCLPWERLTDWQGDGMIVAIDTRDQLDQVIKKGVATVNVSSRLSDLPLPTVVSDNEAIGTLAARHLMEKGLKSFAFAGPMDLDHNVQRLAGFTQTLETAGYSPDVLEIRFIHRFLEYDQQSIVNTHFLGQQLSTLKQPVGVLAPHDDMGCWAIKACIESNLQVPSQVAVLGVNNFELLCNFTTPPLTSVAQASLKIGFEAARMLDQLMSGVTPDEDPMLIRPFGVVARQSSDLLAIDDQYVAHTLRYIRNHADQGINVPDILDHVSLSRRSLEIRFKKAMGHSIEQELINVRLARAKSLLTETTMPITQVALNSGYQSSTGFSVAFRKETGMSPRDYRKQVTTSKDWR